MEHETSILSASRLAVGCAWIQLLDCANGAEEPAVLPDLMNIAPVHDLMNLAHALTVRTCAKFIRSCTGAILIR